MAKSNIVNILKENEFETRFVYPDILEFVGKDNWRHFFWICKGSETFNNYGISLKELLKNE